VTSLFVPSFFPTGSTTHSEIEVVEGSRLDDGAGSENSGCSSHVTIVRPKMKGSSCLICGRVRAMSMPQPREHLQHVSQGLSRSIEIRKVEETGSPPTERKDEKNKVEKERRGGTNT